MSRRRRRKHEAQTNRKRHQQDLQRHGAQASVDIVSQVPDGIRAAEGDSEHGFESTRSTGVVAEMKGGKDL